MENSFPLPVQCLLPLDYPITILFSQLEMLFKKLQTITMHNYYISPKWLKKVHRVTVGNDNTAKNTHFYAFGKQVSNLS